MRCNFASYKNKGIKMNNLFNEMLKQASKDYAKSSAIAYFDGDQVTIENSENKLSITKNSSKGTIKLNNLKLFKLSDIDADLTVRGNKLELIDAIQPERENSSFNGPSQHFPACFFDAKWLKVVGKNDVRYYLNGLNVKRENNNVEIAGSDGHQLTFNNSLKETGDDYNLIVPRDAITLLTKVKDSIVMTLSDDKLRAKFQGDNWTLETRLIDSKYPDFIKIFSQGVIATIEVNRKDMIQTLKEVKPFLNPKIQGVVLSVTTGNLHFEHEGKQLGSMRAGVINGGARLAFNAVYLIAALECYTFEKIELAFMDNAIQLNKLGPQTNIIMSMRL